MKDKRIRGILNQHRFEPTSVEWIFAEVAIKQALQEEEPLIRKHERETIADWLEEELHDYSLSPKGQRSLLRTLRGKE